MGRARRICWGDAMTLGIEEVVVPGGEGRTAASMSATRPTSLHLAQEHCLCRRAASTSMGYHGS
eukprot:6186079-Pyramimonas_sp.AAC.1